MKRELGITQPGCLVEDWPGKYDAFSWLEYTLTIPNPITLVTTMKANGQPNACLHAWSLLIGDRDQYSCLLAILDHHHTTANIRRTGEWCLNYPSFDRYPECFATIAHNEIDCDEITAAGFTLEAAQAVQAPRIHECFANVECRLEWERPLREGSHWRFFLGRVAHAAMEEEMMVTDPQERVRRMALMYNVRGTVNPLTGEFFGPNTLGVLGRVVLPE